MVCAIACTSALAADYTSTSSGDWGTSSAWTPNGVPGVGSSVAISHGRTFATDREFGRSDDASIWSAGNIDLTGDTLTHAAGSTLTQTGGELSGSAGGVFVNNGEFILSQTGSVTHRDNGGGTTFRNVGIFRFAGPGGWTFRAGNPKFENHGSLIKSSGGLTRFNNSFATGTLAMKGGAAGPVSVEAGELAIGVNLTSAGDQAYNIATGAVLNLNSVSLQFADGDAVVGTGSGEFRFTGGKLNCTGTVRFDVTDGNATNTSSGCFRWSSGVIEINGNTVTNSGKIVFEGGDLRNSSGTGRFVNGGYFIHSKAGDFFHKTGGGSCTFLNVGTLEFRSSGGWNFREGGGNLFENRGTLVKTGGDVTWYRNQFGTGTFNNNGGVVQVEAGTLKIDTTSRLAGMTPGTELTSGTYNIIDSDGTNANISTIDWNGNVGSGKFKTIGSNATVRLSGPDTSFDAIDGFNNVEGRFAVQNGKQAVITPSGGELTVAACGILGFGLNAPDTIDPATTTNAFLSVAGSCTIASDATIEIATSGGLVPGRYLLLKADTLTVSPGALTLDTSPAEADGWRGTGRLKKIDNTLIVDMMAVGTVITLF
jgi:hypothetical protein